MSTATMHFHGSRNGTPRSHLDLDRGPDWFADPTRACSPDSLNLRSILAGRNIGAAVFHSTADGNEALAKRICRSCPFQTECLDYALDRGEVHGVWAAVNMGSKSERQTARTVRNKVPALRRKPGPKSDAKPAVKVDRIGQRVDREQQVRALWEQQLPDATIALRLGMSPGAVARIRARLGLRALYGAGGRRLEQASA